MRAVPGVPRIVLEFSPAEASVERGGDDLVFTFGDGKLILQDFYTTYADKKAVPDFLVEGADAPVRGANFLSAYDESLLPAAGLAEAGGSGFYRQNLEGLPGAATVSGGLESLGSPGALSVGDFSPRIAAEAGVPPTAAEAGAPSTANMRFRASSAHNDAPPQMMVEIVDPDANGDGKLNQHEYSSTVTARVTLGMYTAVGDRLVVTDQSGRVVFDGLVAQEMLDDGVEVKTSMPAGATARVEFTATATDPAGNTATASDAREWAVVSNDNISIDSMKGGDSIHGDKSGKVVQGGDDTISIANMLWGSVSGDGDNVEQGGDDVIRVDSMNGNSRASVYGDGYTVERGGDDAISIGSVAYGNIFGDGHTVGEGGDDNISIDAMGHGSVYGDGERVTGRGGDDVIRINSMNSSKDTYVHGDGPHAAVGGDDTITIGVMDDSAGRNKRVCGDGHNIEQGGDDVIRIDTMNGGIAYGDGHNVEQGGDDVVHIGVMKKGAVYGDGHTVAGQGGDDTVIVDRFADDHGAILIDGGKGADMFVYNNGAGHEITLGDDGQVSIAGVTDQKIVIRGFEGIGGGAGNDRITGNAGDNVLRGGKGDDTLTGGGGADTFEWRLDDMDGGTDVVTDFNTQEDSLRLHSGITGSQISAAGNRITISDASGATVLQTIVLDGVGEQDVQTIVDGLKSSLG